MQNFFYILQQRTLCQNESETIIKRQNGKCKQFIVQMVCLSSLNTRVYVWSPTVRTCKLTMMMSTLIWLQIFVCLLLLISTHTKKITELVIGHTEILLRIKCAKCSAKNNYFTYTLHYYALPDQKMTYMAI